MRYQLEITTRCNYSCYYCAGRIMPQKDMTWEMFTSLIDGISNKSYVILQGEGEPTLHPRFWDMVKYTTDAGHEIETTLNGTQLDTELIPKYFRHIGISVDSLDQEYCDTLGRVNVPKVLLNIQQLISVFPAKNITIRTVDAGQSLTELNAWIKDKGLTHLIQPLISKSDYSDNYPKEIQVIKTKRTTLCRYLKKDILRYYTVDGLELPCCFIKNTHGISTIANMKQIMPVACVGCDK